MIDVNSLRNGVTFELDDNLFRVIEYAHNKTGRGKATIRIKIRNLRSGSIMERTFISGDRVQDVRLDYREAQFLYAEHDLYYFMDLDTYEQPVLNKSAVEEAIPFLTENLVVKLTLYEEEPLDIELPAAVDMVVKEAEMAVKGDTATGATKLVVLETGHKTHVPLFVKAGDRVRIDTRTGNYLTRV